MRARILKSFLPLLAMTLVSLVASTARAQIPQTINYQGYLTNAASQPVNAAVNVTFRIYTAASGGSPVWSETQNGIGVANGVFNAVLGSAAALNLPFNVPYFLSLQVNADAEMAGRQPLSAVPYAQRAATAEMLAAGATIAGSQITGTIAGNLLSATQLLPVTPCAANQIPQWNGTAWTCASATTGPQGPAGPQGPPGTVDAATNLTLPNSTATAGTIFKGATAFIHNFGQQNTFVGQNAGNFTMSSTTGKNTGIGNNALSGNTIGIENTANGVDALGLNSTGSANTAIGSAALFQNTSGSSNIAIGKSAGTNLTTGNNNIHIGHSGFATEDKTIRIGAAQQTRAFISGIRGVIPGATNALPVLIDSNGQLGTAAAGGGVSATISGGFGNTASGDQSTVAGGAGNAAGNVRATVSGGATNSASGPESTVAGGNFNRAIGGGSVAGGGSNNVASGDFAVVAGGSSNTASGYHATIAGGTNNTASAAGSTIAGGGMDALDFFGNQATAIASTIGGGISNVTESGGQYGVIAGGQANRIQGAAPANVKFATISGGVNNKVSLGGGTVGGGNGNTASGFDSTVGGGNSNTASGGGATVPGGNSNAAAGAYSLAAGFRAKAVNNGCFTWADNTNADFSCTTDNAFTARAAGGVYLYTSANLATGCQIPAGGGAWSCTSSRETKTDFTTMNPIDVLTRVASLQMTQWRYRTEVSGARHVGPMAEDFHAAFGLGDSTKTINVMDASGIALAAIQGLHQMVKDKNREIDTLKRDFAAIKKKLGLD